MNKQHPASATIAEAFGLVHASKMQVKASTILRPQSTGAMVALAVTL
jgi:hypothetical protein